MIKYKDEKLPVEKVFRDPVHNYIHVQHRVILDLIDSSEFQRLRRIRQLGTTSLTFHGGEHSRFSHSLGVYEITRRICDLFERQYPQEKYGKNGWNDAERLVALCAALLHDVGHGPYSHTFERIFNTNHEMITVEILTSPETEIYQILSHVEPEFPQKVASVIQKTYPNPQVVQLISSQIDADRMDYLLRDAYFTGTQYGTFDLTRILRVIRPYENGIAFQINGMHAVEDYIVSRYQMYMQIYFHPVSRSMEMLLHHLLNRGKSLFFENPSEFKLHSQLLNPFFNEKYSMEDYLKLDDGVLNTYFTQWRSSEDKILSDLAKRFLDRKPFASISVEKNTAPALLKQMQELVEKAGYNPDYYTAINSSFDLPYDFYRPEIQKHRTQIELMRKDGSLVELSSVSSLVAAITGEVHGDERFFFPKEMLRKTTADHPTLFDEAYQEFQKHIHNGTLIP